MTNLNTPYFKDEGDFWTLKLDQNADPIDGMKLYPFGSLQTLTFTSRKGINDYCKERGWTEFTVE